METPFLNRFSVLKNEKARFWSAFKFTKWKIHFWSAFQVYKMKKQVLEALLYLQNEKTRFWSVFLSLQYANNAISTFKTLRFYFTAIKEI